MHMPGVIDTTKNVGIKADNNDQFNVSKTGYSQKELKIQGTSMNSLFLTASVDPIARKHQCQKQHRFRFLNYQ